MKKIVFVLLLLLPFVSFAQVRYEKSFEINSEFGIKESECVYNHFGVEMINGIRISPIFSCGVGVGIGTGKYDFKKIKNNYGQYTISSENTFFVPAYLRAKLNFNKKRVSPFTVLNIGYIFDAGDTSLVNANSFLAEGDVGIDIYFTKNNMLYFMLGYTNRSSEIYIRFDTSHSTIAERHTGMLCFRVGYAF